ncbi:MAG: response regulator [bacterium]
MSKDKLQMTNEGALKKILLVTDEAVLEGKVRDLLSGYEIERLAKLSESLHYITQKKPALVILDFDLPGEGGITAFKQIDLVSPGIPVIALSSNPDIPLAVTATKLGLANFLKRPIDPEQLLAAVRQTQESQQANLLKTAAEIWLQGASPELQKMYAAIRDLVISSKNLVIFGERGIEKEDVVKFIHGRGLGKNRKFLTIDLLNFQKEGMESHFWSAILGALSPTSEERCGTVYLKNIELVDDNFRRTICQYFKVRNEKTDQRVLTIIGFFEKESLPGELLADYNSLTIPPLRQRKSDLPGLLSSYLAHYAALHNKEIKGFAADLLAWLNLYDYPGNYRQLECLIEQGVLASTSSLLDLKDIPINLNDVVQISLKRSALQGLEKKEEFEKEFYDLLLMRTGGDYALVANFLDLPKSAFEKRVRELNRNQVN